jgi:CubicO group peptidase (beta-lactamase class C family)
MERLQFRVLYRQFLFRMADVEALSAHAQGDSNKLLGQFAALLVLVSLVLSLPAIQPPSDNGAIRLGFTIAGEHGLIAVTMLVVGLFGVLCWDLLLPDSRDVLTLAPLPVRRRTLFAAKAAAIATALGLTVGVLHVLAGLIWPVAFSSKSNPVAVPAFTFDAPLPPLPAGEMQTVLTRDLPLPLQPGLGMAVGVARDGVRHTWTYGEARTDTLFEIASISKTFTAAILTRMLAEGRVRLDDRVARRDITVLDLATHWSGLPAMPDNLPRGDQADTLSAYGREALYAWLKRALVTPPAARQFRYSNGGFSVLGQELATRAGMTFEEVLADRVTGPLGLRDTVVSLSSEHERRLAQGHFNGRLMRRWDMDAVAPAGGIRSTVEDMLTYLAAWSRDEMKAGRRLYADAVMGRRIALAWLYDPASETYWHDGATGGYTSYAFFSPARRWAGVVLLNHGPRVAGSPDLIGQHIRQRFAGEPAVSLKTVVVPGVGGLKSFPRWFASYWATMLAAGAFVFSFVLALQGLTALLLPRRLFLRASGWLQMATFGLLLLGFILEPKFPTLDALVEPQAQRPFLWSPAYWFLGVFHSMNGLTHPALTRLGHAAWAGFGAIVAVAGVSYALAYARTLRQVVEAPEIAPSVSGLRWLPPFGGPLATAVTQFSIRTLMRSRQHRLILAFYLGVAFALILFFLRTPAAGSEPAFPATVLTMGFVVAGMRVVFALPLDLRANWMFRAAPLEGGDAMLRARRRALLALAVAPIWMGSAALCWWMLPWRLAAGHAVVLGLVGVAVAEAALFGPVKIPFACSYLPGKSNIHVTFWMCLMGIEALVAKATEAEQWLLGQSWGLAAMAAGLLALIAALRFAKDGSELRFEEEPIDSLVQLRLPRCIVSPGC